LLPSLTGVDLSQRMLAAARAAAHDDGIRYVRAVLEDYAPKHTHST
jgi:predicted TPR repeat methyltransferase